MKRIIFLAPFLFWLPVSFAFGETVVGKIHTVHSNLETRYVHIQMEGSPVPQFSGGSSCINQVWTANSMDDLDFRYYILPILLTAKTTGKDISMEVNGCVGNYPKIVAVDLSPRQK